MRPSTEAAPSIWYAAVAVPQVNPCGNVMPVVFSGAGATRRAAVVTWVLPDATAGRERRSVVADSVEGPRHRGDGGALIP
ncbi:hypothetical protein SNL152K_307 [Streptomyces sp. NL15-2K]|nr:hypothetical protein SNL152K_307 [Streptomyces sp. NL15-2K]